MLYLILLSVICVLHEVNTEEDIIVQTKNGLVRGHVLQTLNKDFSYYAFQGIPYAEPPIDDLRFEAPVPKRNWTGILNATSEGSTCIQHLPANGSEDCLFINVYIPKTDGLESDLLPVMFWIYGGAFDYGSADQYQPDYLITKNVIVVTFNYRVGIFGFFTTGDLVAPGNYGLKDQLLALKWVNENIKNFGGDPNQVTIFGESAGGVSVSYHMQSSKSKGLFQKAIMQSGVSINPWALSRHIPEIIKRIGIELSINVNSSIELKNGLKKVEVGILQIAYVFNVYYEHVFFYDQRNGFAFGPVVEPEHDGAFFTGKSHELLKKGQFANVPCIVGFNSLEAGISFGPFTSTTARIYALLKYDFNNTNLVPVDLNEQQDQDEIIVSKIKHYYIGNSPIATADSLSLVKFLTDDFFLRAIREFVNLISKVTPTYFYRFSYEGNVTGGQQRKYSGVAHAEDLLYLWKMPTNHTPEGQDKITSDRIVSLWTNFAISGNPTPQPIEGVVWQTTDENFTYLDIGSNLTLQQFPEKEAMQFWDDIYYEYGQPPFDTY